MDTKQRLTPEQLETEIRENLSGSDLKAFDMLCMKPTDEHITELLSRNEDLQAESPLREEDLRAQLLYEEGMRSPNAFVREWFAFNLNLNNILAAVICRKHGFDIRKAIVGEGEVQDALRSSNQKDFGLSATLPEIDDILRLSDVEDLYEREKKTERRSSAISRLRTCSPIGCRRRCSSAGISSTKKRAHVSSANSLRT